MKVNEGGFVERITMQISQTLFGDGTIIIIPDGEVEECEYVRVDLYEQLEAENRALKGNDDGTEKCMRCSSMVEQIWNVSNELWDELSGYPKGDGILCSRCFDKKAREKGIYLFWTCQPNSYPEADALFAREDQDDG